MIDLTILQAATYENGSTLPKHYCKARQVGLGESVGPSIKWLDSKPLFSVRLQRFSTVRTNDPIVHDMFLRATRPSSDRRDKYISTVHSLRKASPEAIFAHLPLILNELFSLILDGVGGRDPLAVAVSKVCYFIYFV